MKYGEWEIIYNKAKQSIHYGQPKSWDIYFVGDKKSPSRMICRCFTLRNAKAIAGTLHIVDQLCEEG